MPRRHLALLTTICLLPALVGSALAERAGVAAAVNPATRGTPPGAAMRMITLGAHVFENERIKTDAKGLAQVLLADGTTFTVGPNSDLTIDSFVYNPDAGTAKVVASMTKGVFRFVGGRTSKTKDGVELNTSVGTLVIRGAIADLVLTPSGGSNRAQFGLVFGNEIVLASQDDSERVYMAGYSIVVGSDGRIVVVKTPEGWSRDIQQALAGRPGTSGGSPNTPSNRTVGVSNVPDFNSEYPLGRNTPPWHPLPDPDDIASRTEEDANEDVMREILAEEIID